MVKAVFPLMGFIPDQGSKSLHATQCDQKNKSVKMKNWSFDLVFGNHVSSKLRFINLLSQS